MNRVAERQRERQGEGGREREWERMRVLPSTASLPKRLVAMVRAGTGKFQEPKTAFCSPKRGGAGTHVFPDTAAGR